MRFYTLPLLLVACILVCGKVSALDLLVESNADTGDLSLRFAIQKANIATEDTTITFADNVSVISVETPLPFISNASHAISIDGGGDVRIDGDAVLSPSAGLEIRSANVTLQGLILTNFTGTGIYIGGGATNVQVTGCLIGTDGNITGSNGDGIIVDNATNVTIGGDDPGLRNVISGNLQNGITLFSNAGATTIQGNYIGTTPDGLLPLGNGVGIKITGGTGHTIGGELPGQGNVISGNYSIVGAGLWFSLAGDNSRVLGNIIGLDATGASVLPNAANGIVVDNADNLEIGGASAGARNIISGNTGSGVLMFSSANSTIQGNYIGVNAGGAGAFGNARGIYIENATALQIGGATAGAGNVISNNVEFGILQSNGGTLTIQGNVVGMDANREFPLGNGLSGIAITNATGTVGGLTAAAANLIAYNGGAGIEFSGSIPVTLRRNSIFNNVNDGIQLLSVGLNPPVISTVNPITGTAPASSTIELFVDDDGEGRIYLGAAVADAGGNFSSAIKLSAFRGMTLTAIAINSFGFSSRFSDPAEIVNLNNAHTADTDGDLRIELSELLRLIQFYNTGSIACASPIGSTEDGYTPTEGSIDCAPHPSDYAPQDWVIGLSELLRAIQIFNIGAYLECGPGNEPTEDGYCTIVALP